MCVSTGKRFERSFVWRLQMVGLPDWGHAEVSFSRPRWPMTRHNTPRLARLARSLSSGRLWSKL